MTEPDQRIIVADLRIPFFRLVVFFVKCALAVIPAAIIVTLLIMVLTAIVVALFGDSTIIMRRWTN